MTNKLYRFDNSKPNLYDDDDYDPDNRNSKSSYRRFPQSHENRSKSDDVMLKSYYNEYKACIGRFESSSLSIIKEESNHMSESFTIRKNSSSYNAINSDENNNVGSDISNNNPLDSKFASLSSQKNHPLDSKFASLGLGSKKKIETKNNYSRSFGHKEPITFGLRENHLYEYPDDSNLDLDSSRNSRAFQSKKKGNSGELINYLSSSISNKLSVDVQSKKSSSKNSSVYLSEIQQERK